MNFGEYLKIAQTYVIVALFKLKVKRRNVWGVVQSHLGLCMRDWSVKKMAKKMTEREQFYYGKGYAQGKIDFAIEVRERIGCIEACDDDEYNMGVDWAVCEALKIINETVGGSDDRE